MVHDEEEGTSVQLTALLPASATAAQPTQGHASAATPANPSTANVSAAQLQRGEAPSAAPTSTDMPSSICPADDPISQEVDMDVEVFDEPVSPAVLMEPLSDAEEGTRPAVARSRRLQSLPSGRKQPDRSANELQGSSMQEGNGHPRRSTPWQEQSAGPSSGFQGADLKKASTVGAPVEGDPPPPPPDNPPPPPPPPPPEVDTKIDTAAELHAREQNSRHFGRQGKASTVTAALGRPPPLPADSSNLGMRSGLLSALLPVEGPAASCPTAGTKPVRVNLPEGQSGSRTSRLEADDVQLAGQHLLSPAEHRSYIPLWTHAPHSTAQVQTGMQGHRSPPYLQQPQLKHGRRLKQQWQQPPPQPQALLQPLQPAGNLQEQHWLQQQPHVQLPQQQQPSGGGHGALADSGGLGGMLQSIMENVRSAGAAVRQMGPPVLPPGQLGPPSGQAGIPAAASHPQHCYAPSTPPYSANTVLPAQGAMQPGPHNDDIGSSQQAPAWQQQPSGMQINQPQLPYEHSWQPQQSAAGQMVGTVLLTLCV